MKYIIELSNDDYSTLISTVHRFIYNQNDQTHQSYCGVGGIECSDCRLAKRASEVIKRLNMFQGAFLAIKE